MLPACADVEKSLPNHEPLHFKSRYQLPARNRSESRTAIPTAEVSK
jgi:hypothetical protein